MKKPPAIIMLSLAALTYAASSLTAQTTSSTNAPQQLSPKAAAAISSGFKYQPPPPPKPVSETDEVDLRDVDKPQNEIIRLPKYTVTAKKPPVFNDRALYTKEQLKHLAVSRYLTGLDKNGLNRWTIPGLGTSNEERAMNMYLEDERLGNMAKAEQNIANMRATGDAPSADAAQKSYYDTFLRRRDFTDSIQSSATNSTDTLQKQQGK